MYILIPLPNWLPMSDLYDEILKDIKETRTKDIGEKIQIICEILRSRISKYSWVGFYLLEGGKLRLYRYSGKPTQHVEINLGDGICSLAITRNATVNERDVHSNSDYLACFPTTKSELVVPIRYEERPIGEIDIDSDERGAFDEKDEKLIEEIVRWIGPLLSLYISVK